MQLITSHHHTLLNSLMVCKPRQIVTLTTYHVITMATTTIHDVFDVSSSSSITCDIDMSTHVRNKMKKTLSHPPGTGPISRALHHGRPSTASSKSLSRTSSSTSLLSLFSSYFSTSTDHEIGEQMVDGVFHGVKNNTGEN